MCFEEWHEIDFEILLAARPLRTDAAPDEPTQEAVVHEIPEVIQETDTDKLSAVEWQKIQERQHVLIDKPPTKCRINPGLLVSNANILGERGKMLEHFVVCANHTEVYVVTSA